VKALLTERLIDENRDPSLFIDGELIIFVTLIVSIPSTPSVDPVKDCPRTGAGNWRSEGPGAQPWMEGEGGGGWPVEGEGGGGRPVVAGCMSGA